MLYYTGIGSRDTPDIYLKVFFKIAGILAKKGFTLRSGGANGADDAFEKGCIEAGGEKEIFLPWSKFNGRSEKDPGYYYTRSSHYDLYKRAKVLASSFHPAWDNLADSAKMLHTRNVHQVLGLTLEEPSKFLVCYSAVNINPGESGYRGGTGQALRIAKSLSIPSYNFASDESSAQFLDMLKVM